MIHAAGKEPPPLVLGITGSSGAAIARRIVERLAELNQPVVAVASNAARRVWNDEIGGSLDEWLRERGVPQFKPSDIGATIASGSFETAGMLVAPCSMNRVAEFAHGISSDLLGRAVDVTIKESRRLVLVPRESPLSVIHLTNLLTLAQAGVRIVVPVPAFYNLPQSVEEIIDQIAGRALSAAGIRDALPDQYRYRGPSRPERG